MQDFSLTLLGCPVHSSSSILPLLTRKLKLPLPPPPKHSSSQTLSSSLLLTSLIDALVTSRLGHCNSILLGSTYKTFTTLQQDLCCPPPYRETPSARSHMPSIQDTDRIHSSALLISYRTLNNTAPSLPLCPPPVHKPSPDLCCADSSLPRTTRTSHRTRGGRAHRADGPPSSASDGPLDTPTPPGVPHGPSTLSAMGIKSNELFLEITW